MTGTGQDKLSSAPAPAITAWRWGIPIILGLCILVDGMDMQMLSLAIPAIVRDWHVARDALAPALSFTFAAAAIGSAGGGALGDRHGRRRLLIASIALFALATAGIALAPNLRTLTLLRIASGLGLGSAMPNASSLLVQAAPPARRSALITLGAACVPVGGIIGGALAGWLLPSFGWRALFWAGTLAAALVMVPLWLIPESDRRALPAPAPANRDRSRLLAPTYRRDTLTYWGAALFGMYATYSILSWLPAMLGETHYSFRFVGLAMSTLNIGGLAFGLASAGAIAAFGLRSVVLTMAAIGAMASLAVAAVGISHEVPPSLLLVLFALQGGCVAGVAIVLYPIGAHLYPDRLRSTGIGCGIGWGRAAAIVSPILAGWLLNSAGPRALFASDTCAMACCWICLALIRKPASRAPQE